MMATRSPTAAMRSCRVINASSRPRAQRKVARNEERPPQPPEQPCEDNDEPKTVPTEYNAETSVLKVGNDGPIESLYRLAVVVELPVTSMHSPGPGNGPHS